MRKCTLSFNIIFFIIILIFQIILTSFQSKKDNMKKKEYIQWDKKLITDISIQKEKYKEQKFDESDSSKPMQFYSNSRREILKKLELSEIFQFKKRSIYLE